MSKFQIIEAIQQINRSASLEWLADFEIPALRSYLDHLQLVLEPRGRQSTWQRPGDTAAFISRQPAL